MDSGIRLTRIWSDNDMVELRITVNDGTSRFVNHVYVGYANLEETISSLETFKDQVHGGLLDLSFGAFGPEYASGAFHARLHFAVPGRLYVSCRQESDYAEFGKKKIASSASLHLVSEPALLDRFIRELRRLASTDDSEAFLEAV